MLDNDEYRQMMGLRPIGKGGESLRAMSTPMLAEYERITGLRETNPLCRERRKRRSAAIA
jgi:hypothetical protein